MAYRIEEFNYIHHPDGSMEILISDASLQLVLDGLDKMGLSLPIPADQWETVEEYLKDLDAEIGGMELDRIRATKEYDDMVGIAMDEFMHGYRDAYIDYDSLNSRLARMLSDCGVGGKYTLDITKWLPQEPLPKESKKGKRRPY